MVVSDSVLQVQTNLFLSEDVFILFFCVWVLCFIFPLRTHWTRTVTDFDIDTDLEKYSLQAAPGNKTILY